MRATSWVSLRFLATSPCCVTILLVACNPVWTQESNKENDRIKELRQRRLTLLVEARDFAVRLLQVARVEFEDYHCLERNLMNAHIAYGEAPTDRVKAIDVAITNAKDWVQFLEELLEAKRVRPYEVKKGQIFVLELELMREAEARK